MCPVNFVVVVVVVVIHLKIHFHFLVGRNLDFHRDCFRFLELRNSLFLMNLSDLRNDFVIHLRILGPLVVVAVVVVVDVVASLVFCYEECFGSVCFA